MQRRSRLVSRTRIRRLTGLRVKSAPKPRRVQPAVPVDVRAALAERSGGWCEMHLDGCLGRATDPAHRITRKNGGRHQAAKAHHDRLSNVLHACRLCHDWCGARPTEAKDLGLSLEEWQDPAQEPVHRRGELVYLADDGRVVPFEEAGP